MTEPAIRGPRRARDIFDAALTLLGELGYDGVTIEGVAARSGVNKTTLYRWWPSKDALLREAIVESRLLELRIPDTGNLRDDLTGLLTQILRLLTGRGSGRLASMIPMAIQAATHRPELAELAREFLTDRLSRELPVFDRAVRRGELRADVDPKLLMDLLTGALWVRVFLRGERPTRPFVDSVVDLALAGARP